MNVKQIFEERSRKDTGQAKPNPQAVALERLRQSLNRQTQPTTPGPTSAVDQARDILGGLKNIAAKLAQRAARVLPATSLVNDPASIVKANTAAADRAQAEIDELAKEFAGRVTDFPPTKRGLSPPKVYAERHRATLPLVDDPAARR